MSVEAISLVLNHSAARGTTKLVLVGIANHHGDGGSWPTTATLARYAGTTERNVRRAVAELVELGEVVVHVNGGGTHLTPNDRRPNRYEITLTKPVDDPSHGGTPSAARESNGRTPTSEREDTRRLHGRTPSATEPSMNHQRRPAGQPARSAKPVDNLPAPAAALRAAFAARTDLVPVAWTRLSADQARQIADLVDEHGVETLVAVAANQRRPRLVQAYISEWQALTVPVLPTGHTEPTCDICTKPKRVCERAARTAGAAAHEFIERRTA